MYELSLLCPQDQVELVADALEALHAQSVSVEDADARTDSEQALFGEPGLVPDQIGWRRSDITALFEDKALADAAAKSLQAQDFFANCALVSIQRLEPQDWVRLTQSQFEPVPVCPGFWIVPTWHEPPPAATHVIRLDPGLAFGTGTHPTTRMCLQWIAEGRDTHKLGRVLDYGCGSGILAIAAAKFDATEVVALDIDSAAVQSAQNNARANGVAIQCGLPQMAQGRYQTVLANILATPLKVLAPLLANATRLGGKIVLSGILKEQAEDVMAIYAQWFDFAPPVEEEGWVCLAGVQR